MMVFFLVKNDDYNNTILNNTVRRGSIRRCECKTSVYIQKHCVRVYIIYAPLPRLYILILVCHYLLICFFVPAVFDLVLGYPAIVAPFVAFDLHFFHFFGWKSLENERTRQNYQSICRAQQQNLLRFQAVHMCTCI